MGKCKKKRCEQTERSGKMAEKATKEQECVETLHGIIVMRKGKLEEREVWFGTVGNQLVSDGAYNTKKELIENLENMTLDRVCKIVAGAFERAITYKEAR